MYPNTTTLTERYIVTLCGAMLAQGTTVCTISLQVTGQGHEDAALCQGCWASESLDREGTKFAASMPTELSLKLSPLSPTNSVVVNGLNAFVPSNV